MTSADDYNNQAIILGEKKQFEKAIILLDKAIDKREKFRPALLNRGNFKSMLGNFEGGIEDYKKVLEFDPDNTIALCHIAYNYGSMNNHNKAVEYYSMALETNGAIPSFTGSNGKTMAINRNLDIMNANKDSDSQYNVIDCNIYFNRGMEYLEIGQFDNSIEDFKKSLKSSNAVRDCYFYIGEAYLYKKDTLNACENFKKSSNLGDLDAKDLISKNCFGT